MELSVYFKSVLEQDTAAVVICNLQHEIIYMNPAAIKSNEKRGGAGLLGKSIFNCHIPKSNEKMMEVIGWFEKSPENNIVYTFYNEKENRDVYMIAMRDDSKKLIGYYEKHEYRNAEHMKRYCMD